MNDSNPAFSDLQQEIIQLRHENEELRRLASFPQLNPVPIFEFNHLGELVYLNQAGQKILSELDLTDEKSFLPDDFSSFYATARESVVLHYFKEIRIKDHVFEKTVIYSPEYDTVRIYAEDITHHVQMEEALNAKKLELIQTQEFLEAVTKGAGVIIATVDKDLRYTYFNQAYQDEVKRLSGKDIRIGTSLLEPFADLPNQQSVVLREWSQVLRGESTNKILEFGDPGQYRRTYNVLHTPIRDAEENVVGAGEVAYDITPQLRIEEALRLSEERYHSLFKSMTEGIAIHEMIFDEKGEPYDYRFLDINPAFERLTGLQRERVIGKTYRQVLPEEGDRWINVYGKVVITGDPIQFEEYSPTLNRYYEIFAYLYAPMQFATIFLDITERKHMEDDLRINLTKYSVLFDTLPLGVTVTDQNGHILESNQEATRLLGLSEEEQKKRLIEGEEWKIVRPDGTLMPSEEYASVRAIQEQRRIENVEMGIVKDDDQISWISVTAVPIPLENYGVVITYNNITRRMQAEEALRKAHERLELTVQQRTRELVNANDELKVEIEERKRVETELVVQTKAVEAQRQRFNDVLEVLPAYLILLTPDYRVAFTNRYFRERFGEDHGRHCYEYLFNRSQPCENCESYKALRTGNSHHWEWTGPDARNYDVYDFPFTDVDGSSLILEMGIDITARKQAEEQLRSLNAYNRSLIEANLDALVTITPDGRIGDVNNVTEAITGYSRDDLIGTDFHTYFTDPEKARSGYEQVFETGLVRDYELEIQHKDGHSTPVVYNASIYRDESGKVAGVFAAARDITERKQAEEELRKLNAYNRSLIEANLDALVTITPEGKIGDVNSVSEAITGYRRDELIGMDFDSYFTHPEKARTGYQRVFETGMLRDYELEIQHKDGHSTPVVYNASVYKDESGNVRGVFAAARDITERKRAERQLVLLNTALETAANGIIVADRDGTILWSNPAFSRMTGYSTEEIIGKNPRFLKSGKQDLKFYENLWQTILSGHVWRGEIINRRKEGNLYYEQQTITPVFDRSGIITNFISIRQDITEQKQAEAALINSEEQYRSLVIATSQIVWRTDAHGQVVEDNPLWRAFTGQSVDEFISSGWINALHPADQERIAEIWAEAVKTGTPYDAECRISNASGDYSDFAVRGVPIKDKDGNILSWVGTCTDITDKKRVENQLLQSEKHAVIGRMVGSVTHEINNPLQTIKNCLYLIQQETETGSPNTEPLEMALSETQRLSDLVGQLRQLYRSKAAQAMHSHELSGILEAVHSMIIPQLAMSKVTWQIGPGFRECQVNCVKDQLIEVFLNISLNAIEAMKQLGGTLSVDMTYPEKQRQVGIIFTDTGQGIAADMLPHIFEPFITTKEYGLGLGLSICYDIVQKHGGHITVESQPGRGTSFTVWLPVDPNVEGREE